MICCLEKSMELTQFEVMKITGISYATIDRKEKIGEFPKRFKIDRFHVRWHERQIREWMKQNDNDSYRKCKKWIEE